jgi:hypothetical protein
VTIKARKVPLPTLKVKVGVIRRKPKEKCLLPKTLVGVVVLTTTFQKNCPDAKDVPAQEVVRGTNLVSMVSLVIPHDTFDNEDISLSESRVMLSFNSDNDFAVETMKRKVNTNITAAAKYLPQGYILLDNCGVQISSATSI